MTLPKQLGHPVDDRDEIAPHRRVGCGATPLQEETPLPTRTSRRVWPPVAGAALIAAALTGLLTTKAIVPASATPSVPPAVAGTAELFTSLYLAGASPDRIARVFTGEPPPPGGTWVNQAAAVAVDQVGTDLWEVTVAVDSLEPSEGQFEAVPLGFYLVPIATMGDTAMAVGAPARVTAPAFAGPTAASTAPVAADKAAVARQFVELHLMADPEAARLLVNPAAVDLFPAPPYEDVAAEVVGADSLGRIIVVVLAATASAAEHRLEYLVTLEASEAGWRVSAIGAATR